MDKPLGTLSGFQIVRPRHELDQNLLLDSQAGIYAAGKARLGNRVTATQEEEVKMRRVVRRFAGGVDRISRRGVEIDDPVLPNGPDRIYAGLPGSVSNFEVPSDEYSGPAGRGIYRRMLRFQAGALRIFSVFYPEGSTHPDHLIHVTCTGYVAPSAAQVFVQERGWNETTEVTHAYHMGCYASLPAIRMATALARSRAQTVDIAHTELCSLHMNMVDFSPEQIVVNSLFADGAIKYSVSQDLVAESGLEVHAVLEYLVPGTLDRMTWTVGDVGMRMTLARNVPEHIAGHLARFLERLAEKAGVSPQTLTEEALFSIHPGGPRIIDSVLDLLRLREEQVVHSRGILHDHGNMSSATLPHVWNRILEDPAALNKRWVVALAFGPGLTLFGSVMKLRRADRGRRR